MSTAAREASPDAPTAPEVTYFDDWIAQLNALNGLSPAAAPSALRQALQHAPSHRRPSDEDARLFATAGTSTATAGGSPAVAVGNAAAPPPLVAHAPSSRVHEAVRTNGNGERRIS